MKRIATVQDLSCVGKCSLSIALPVLSAMGVECCVMPTAVLSAHTAFDGFVSRDLTDLLAPVSAHWQQLGLTFDALYTGYLASPAQVDFVEAFFDRFGGEHTLRFVDPVMADQGRLYAGFDDGFPEKMRRLCARADIITPNITEACLLTGTLYREQHDEDYVRALLEKLLAFGPRTVILTGVRPADGRGRHGRKRRNERSPDGVHPRRVPRHGRPLCQCLRGLSDARTQHRGGHPARIGVCGPDTPRHRAESGCPLVRRGF